MINGIFYSRCNFPSLHSNIQGTNPFCESSHLHRRPRIANAADSRDFSQLNKIPKAHAYMLRRERSGKKDEGEKKFN